MAALREDTIPDQVVVQAPGHNQYEELFAWLARKSSALTRAERQSVWKFLKFCGAIVEKVSLQEERLSGVSPLSDSMTDPPPATLSRPAVAGSSNGGSVIESGEDTPCRPSSKELGTPRTSSTQLTLFEEALFSL